MQLILPERAKYNLSTMIVMMMMTTMMMMMMTMTIEKNVDDHKTKCEFKIKFSFASVMGFNTFAAMVTILAEIETPNDMTLRINSL